MDSNHHCTLSENVDSYRWSTAAWMRRPESHRRRQAYETCLRRLALSPHKFFGAAEMIRTSTTRSLKTLTLPLVYGGMKRSGRNETRRAAGAIRTLTTRGLSSVTLPLVYGGMVGRLGLAPSWLGSGGFTGSLGISTVNVPVV